MNDNDQAATQPTQPTEEQPQQKISRYRLEKRLKEAELKLRWPNLTPKWRRRMASPMAPQQSTVRGRQGLARKDTDQ